MRLFFFEVADVETRFFPLSRRHYVGFTRDLTTAGSVVEHVGLFFFAKKAGAQRFTIDARTGNRLFF